MCAAIKEEEEEEPHFDQQLEIDEFEFCVCAQSRRRRPDQRSAIQPYNINFKESKKEIQSLHVCAIEDEELEEPHFDQHNWRSMNLNSVSVQSQRRRPR